MDDLQNGISARYFADGEERSALVYLVDYQNPVTNSFIGKSVDGGGKRQKRPDILPILNGIPIVVIELKSPAREETDASEAYLQLQNFICGNTITLRLQCDLRDE